MRRIFMQRGAIAVFIFIMFTTVSFAWAKDFDLTLGAKFWYHKWGSSSFSSQTRDANAVSLDSDYNILVTPTVSLRYKKFLLAGSYATGPEFEFSSYTDLALVGSGTCTDTGTGATRECAVSSRFSTKADRTEWDVAVGYIFLRYFSLFAGYKSIEQEFKTTSTILTPGLVGTGVPSVSEGTTTIKGPVVGLQGSGPIGDTPLLLFGNVTYGLLKSEFGGGTPDADSPMLSSEVGLAYRFPRQHIQTALSYKVQVIYTDLEDISPNNRDQEGPDVTNGPILAISLFF